MYIVGASQPEEKPTGEGCISDTHIQTRRTKKGPLLGSKGDSRRRRDISRNISLLLFFILIVRAWWSLGFTRATRLQRIGLRQEISDGDLSINLQGVAAYQIRGDACSKN